MEKESHFNMLHNKWSPWNQKDKKKLIQLIKQTIFRSNEITMNKKQNRNRKKYIIQTTKNPITK